MRKKCENIMLICAIMKIFGQFQGKSKKSIPNIAKPYLHAQNRCLSYYRSVFKNLLKILPKIEKYIQEHKNLTNSSKLGFFAIKGSLIEKNSIKRDGTKVFLSSGPYKKLFHHIIFVSRFCTVPFASFSSLYLAIHDFFKPIGALPKHQFLFSPPTSFFRLRCSMLSYVKKYVTFAFAV